MPELDFALVSDFVRAEGGVGHAIAAGIDTITTPAVPVAHTVGLLFRLEFRQSECGRPHRFEVIFQSVDGERLAHLTTVVTPEWKAGLPIGWPVGLIAGINMAIPLPRYGEYAFEILVNDSFAKSIRIRVIAPPDAAAPDVE